jgi:hypothetical protein
VKTAFPNSQTLAQNPRQSVSLNQRHFLKSLSPEDIELFGDTLDADNNRLVDDFIGGK